MTTVIYESDSTSSGTRDTAGRVVRVTGPVVDVEFPRESVPKVYDALKVDNTEITLEVQQQLGDGVVRTIALGSSDGLRRGIVTLCIGGGQAVALALERI